MRSFFARVVLALKFCTRLDYSWHRAWHNARRSGEYDEHANVHHAGTL